jgi:hypothetical protein
MIIYILLLLILIIIICFIFIRIKYKFWNLQPVFHYYNIYYRLFNIGIIEHELPKKNKYINLKNIQSLNINEVTNEKLNELSLLVQKKIIVINNNKIFFRPKKDNIISYFIGNNNACYVSFYNEPNLLYDSKRNNIIEDTKMVGLITSRPLRVSLAIDKKINKFDIYYIDYLTIDKDYRDKDIIFELIQTHEYFQRHNNKNISVSLLKSDNEKNGIIPLTEYKNYIFSMINWKKPASLNAKIQILNGDEQNIYYLYNFINEYIDKWKITIIAEMSNILELVKTKNIFVKMLVYNNEIETFYIFKKSCYYIDKEKEIISCICSMNGNKLTNNEFIDGFKVSLWSIIEEYKDFQYLSIENISNNNIIINNICIKSTPYIIMPMKYFFYNFVYELTKSEKILVIN